jgi:hypothetical protein
MFRKIYNGLMKGIKTEIEFLKLIDLILEIKKEINDKL